jgi:hypothetical protein
MPPLIANMSDNVTGFTDTISNQGDLLASFDSLLNKVAILIEVGDEVAQVRPHYVHAYNIVLNGRRSTLTSILHGKCSPQD